MGNVTLQGHEIEATFTTDKAGDYIIECTSFTEYEMWLSPEVNATMKRPGSDGDSRYLIPISRLLSLGTA